MDVSVCSICESESRIVPLKATKALNGLPIAFNCLSISSLYLTQCRRERVTNIARPLPLIFFEVWLLKCSKMIFDFSVIVCG